MAEVLEAHLGARTMDRGVSMLRPGTIIASIRSLSLFWLDYGSGIESTCVLWYARMGFSLFLLGIDPMGQESYVPGSDSILDCMRIGKAISWSMKTIYGDCMYDDGGLRGLSLMVWSFFSVCSFVWVFVGSFFASFGYLQKRWERVAKSMVPKGVGFSCVWGGGNYPCTVSLGLGGRSMLMTVYFMFLF